ncbi:MAG: methyltransferase domain-containing protein [Nitrososphaerota archaeon]|nr:methyltransferase domain-containing protein [Nitrososphaerota archaeon]
MSEGPYLASEDSALLRAALVGYSGKSCLEIGAGNGGNLIALAKGFEIVVGTDVVKPSMADWREKSDFVLADRAACLRSGSFDLVTFNPPYLEGDETGDVAVEGGRRLEVPRAFLSEAFRVVKGDGKVVFLVNGAMDVEEVRAACGEWGFGLRLLTSHRVFFEVLSVYEAARRAGEEHAARSEERKAAVGMHGPGSPAPIARVTN